VDNLIQISKEISSTFVHISTDYVFSGIKISPYSIHDKVNPINAYGVSKALGEKFIKQSEAKKYYVFRTAWLYSEFGTNFVKSILNKYQSNSEKISVVTDQFGNPTLASDLALQIIQAINLRVPYGFYHAVNSGSTSWYDLAVKAIKYAGYDPSRIYGITSDKYPSAVKRPMNTSLESTKWNDISIPEMRSWQEALKSAIPRIIQNT
jgi:dTDP-4-dehydrorhamnose reductase